MRIHQVPVSGLFFIAMSKPFRTASNALRYAVSFPANELPDELAKMVPQLLEERRTSDKPLLQASSSFKPRIFGKNHDHSDVAKARQYGENVGCSIDEMLRGAPATVLLVMFEHQKFPDGYGLGLEGLIVDTSKLFWPTPAEPRNRRKFEKEENLWNAPTD